MTDHLLVGVVVLQAGIAAILLEAIRRGNVPAAVNAIVSFGAVLAPGVVEAVGRLALARSLSLGPELALWIAVAGLLHSFGMLGPYDSVWWWDHLTHTVSAAFVAAVMYGGLAVAVEDPATADRAWATLAALTVSSTFAAGVFWEVIELAAHEVGDRFDIDPVLVHYGWRDTAVDLVFDVVGALVVVLFEVDVFVPVARQAPGLTSTALLGGGVLVTVGSVVLALGVLLARRERQPAR